MINLCNGMIKIRDFKESDIENKVRWINDEKNNAYLHYDIPLEYEKTLCWFNNKDNSKRIDCVIEYQEIPVGLIGLVNIDKINKKAEFYITLGETIYKRRGIGFEATKMLLNYAYSIMDISKVYLNVDEDNKSACSLYEKVGFRCEGTFAKDMLHRGKLINRKRYALLKEEFEIANKKCNLNILVLSAGTRNKIIQYFKKELNGYGKVIATDMSEIAPSLYEADKYYIVPRITDENYLNIILNICKEENIFAVFSLIDPELGLLAKHEKEFKGIGVQIIGSSEELCDLSLNKMDMYEWLMAHGYKTAKSYIDKDDFYKDLESGSISFPVFVKPVCGSASLSISKVYDVDTLELLLSKNDNLIIQEYMNGQEIGADVYIDMISGEVISIFTKKKIVMRAGETDKSVSFKDDKLFGLIERFVKEAGYKGQIDIDIFEIDGEYYISEVNPRFGGGYPHAYECGCNHIKMIINNVLGIENQKNIGCYDENIYMMKYNEVMFRR